MPRPADGVVVLVDRPSSPGNLGTIIRTADALGAAGVLTTGHGAHLYDPQTDPGQRRLALRPPGRAGAEPTRRWSTGSTAGGRRHRLTVYATDEGGDVVLDGHRRWLVRPLLLLGSERTGLSRALRDLADVTLAIPMAGSASSLNVAVAHGIVLHPLLSTVTPHG